MVVEINVDEDIELINAWAVIDAGEVVNADGVKNQIEGGIIQATSCTLIEEVNFLIELYYLLKKQSFYFLNLHWLYSVFLQTKEFEIYQ